MKTTLFLINAALCFTIGVSLASETLPEDVNNKQIIPKLNSQALSNYASTNTTNYTAVKAYKTENKIDEKFVLIHCPSATEMMSILSEGRDIRTGMDWDPGTSFTKTLIDELSGCMLKKIYISKDSLVCEYTKKGQKFSILCERLLKPSQSSFIMDSWAPSHPNIRVNGVITFRPNKRYNSTIFIGTIVPTFRLENSSEHTPQASSKLLPESEKEGVDLIFNQAKRSESFKPSPADLFHKEE